MDDLERLTIESACVRLMNEFSWRVDASDYDGVVDLFTQLGGLMAERVTDLKDIRDRVIAELSGLPEPGVPLPAVPSILCA